MGKPKKATDRELLRVVTDSGFNQSEAARRIGMSPQAVNKRLNKPRLKKTFAQLLEKDKRTNAKALCETMAEGLNATKVISAQVIVTPNKAGSLEKDTPEVKELIADEKSTDFIDIPDYATRHKYLVTALEVRSDIHQHQGNGGSSVTAVYINIRNPAGLLTEAETEHLSHERREV